MIVFYTEKKEGSHVVLSDEEFRHCVKSLRHKVGDEIKVFDSSGDLFTCKIIGVGRSELKAEIKSAATWSVPHGHISLAIASTKNADRIEWLISKIVEIGIQTIYLIETEHSERSRYKMDRLVRIAFSAAKQSLQFKIPEIVEVSTLQSLMELTSHVPLRLIAHCHSPAKHVLAHPIKYDSHVLLMVGPEGDFSTTEVALALEYGCKEIGLGASRLRTETAGLVAVTCVRAMMELESI